MTDALLPARLHATIEGHVQGVGFRYFVEDVASSFGLVGWVRNRWDGSVEVVAEGPRNLLEQLLACLYRGPRAADVRGVAPEWLPPTGEFKTFSIRSSAG